MLCKRVHRFVFRRLFEWPSQEKKQQQISLTRNIAATSDIQDGPNPSPSPSLSTSVIHNNNNNDNIQHSSSSPIFRVLTCPQNRVKRQRWPGVGAELAQHQQKRTPQRQQQQQRRGIICNAEMEAESAERSPSAESVVAIFPSTAHKMPAFNVDSDSPAKQPPAMPNSIHLNARDFQRRVLNEIDTFIFDADGVLWLGEQSIHGSAEFVDRLASLGKRIIVLTNNATKSRAVYAKKLSQLGFGRCVTEHNIVNPAAVVADVLYRSRTIRAGKKVYLIGGQGVKDEMAQLDISFFGDGHDPVDEQPASKGSAFLYELELEEELDQVGAVVVGYEKYFNYLKLMKAANYLRNNECMFLATNEDETCPGPNPGTVIPDAGPLVAAVKTASGRDPVVVGKPNASAFDYICRRWNINPRRTMMVGDRLNTDVKFGRDHGLRTMLVLSGCHGVEHIVDGQMQGRHDLVPDFYANSLGALLGSGWSTAGELGQPKGTNAMANGTNKRTASVKS